MVIESVFRGVWDSLTDPSLKMEWDEAALIVGGFLFFGLIQWLTLKCRRRWVRYIPLLLMTVFWILTEYAYASEPSMGAILIVVFMGYPAIMGLSGTICACVIWHIRKIFRKTT